MNTYKVGDKVIIRKDLENGEVYCGIEWRDEKGTPKRKGLCGNP